MKHFVFSNTGNSEFIFRERFTVYGGWAFPRIVNLSLSKMNHIYISMIQLSFL